MTDPLEEPLPDEATGFERADDVSVSLDTGWPTEQMMGAPQLANAFLVQVLSEGDSTPGDIILSTGFLAPPPFSGSIAEQRKQAQEFVDAGNVLPVMLLSRVAVSQQRLTELRDIIDDTLRRIEEARNR